MIDFQREEVEGGDEGPAPLGADPFLSDAPLHPLQQAKNLLRRGIVESLFIQLFGVVEVLSSPAERKCK